MQPQRFTRNRATKTPVSNEKYLVIIASSIDDRKNVGKSIHAITGTRQEGHSGNANPEVGDASVERHEDDSNFKTQTNPTTRKDSFRVSCPLWCRGILQRIQVYKQRIIQQTRVCHLSA
jgi:hypothetical protein